MRSLPSSVAAQPRQSPGVCHEEALDSRFEWTPEARKRLNRVPAGFMRNITQSRIEQRVQEAGVEKIDLDFAARVIEDGRSLDNPYPYPRTELRVRKRAQELLVSEALSTLTLRNKGLPPTPGGAPLGRLG